MIYFTHMPHKGYKQTEEHRASIANSCTNLHSSRLAPIRDKKNPHTLFSARQIINQSTRWRLMKKSAKSFYGNKCKLCPSTKYLECHHEPSLESMIIEFLKACNYICSINDLLAFDKFFDLQYITLLCKDCHKHNELHMGIHTHGK
jgi:hypothetical protein